MKAPRRSDINYPLYFEKKRVPNPIIRCSRGGIEESTSEIQKGHKQEKLLILLVITIFFLFYLFCISLNFK